MLGMNTKFYFCENFGSYTSYKIFPFFPSNELRAFEKFLLDFLLFGNCLRVFFVRADSLSLETLGLKNGHSECSNYTTENVCFKLIYNQTLLHFTSNTAAVHNPST